MIEFDHGREKSKRSAEQPLVQLHLIDFFTTSQQWGKKDMTKLQQIATPASTTCGIRVGTTVRAVGVENEVTGVITKIWDEDGERQIRIKDGPLGLGRSYNTVFTEGKVTLTPVCVPAEGALLVLEARNSNLVGISYSQEGAFDWIMGNADVDDYAVAAF